MRVAELAIVVAAVFVILFAALVLLVAERRAGPIALNPGEPLTRDGVAMMMICKPVGWHGTPTHTARAYLEPEYAYAERGRWTKRDRGDCIVLYHHDEDGPIGQHRDAWRQDRPLH